MTPLPFLTALRIGCARTTARKTNRRCCKVLGASSNSPIEFYICLCGPRPCHHSYQEPLGRITVVEPAGEFAVRHAR